MPCIIVAVFDALRYTVRMRLSLEKVAEDIWAYSVPPSGRSMPLGGRSVIVRLRDEALWVHSPCPGVADLHEPLRALGSVRYLIAPSQFHNLYMAQWHKAYPAAEIWTAPGMQKRLADQCTFPVHAELGGERRYPWSEALDQHLVRGADKLQETVFLHRASRSLILTDLAFNVRSGMGAVGTLMMKLNGAYGRFGPSRVMRYVFTSDKPALRSSIDTLCSWDFDRIIPAHGDIVETGGPQALREAFAYLY